MQSINQSLIIRILVSQGDSKSLILCEALRGRVVSGCLGQESEVLESARNQFLQEYDLFLAEAILYIFRYSVAMGGKV